MFLISTPHILRIDRKIQRDFWTTAIIVKKHALPQALSQKTLNSTDWNTNQNNAICVDIAKNTSL